MGLIRNALNAVGNIAKDVAGTAGDSLVGGLSGAFNQGLLQEYFASGDMSGDVIMRRAEQVRTSGSRNTKSDHNIISAGSVIDVQENQCMIIVENGKVVEACSEAGRFIYDTSIAPSFFEGDGKFGERFKNVAKQSWEQAKMGGQRKNTQRIYFINTGVLDRSLNWGAGNIAFQHTETFAGLGGAALARGVTLKGFGTARLRVERPLDFFEEYGAKFVGGDNTAVITMESLETFLAHTKNRVTEAIAISITELSNNKPIRYNQVMTSANMAELRNLVNAQMEDTDLHKIGFDFYEFTVGGSGFQLNPEDKKKIDELQEQAFKASNVNMANFTIQDKMAEGFKAAGENGGVAGIMGMNMAMGGGMNLGNMQHQNVPQQAHAAVVHPVVDAWQCACGATATGRFCSTCGAKKPEPKPANVWNCVCGAVVNGNFCPECGMKKPEENKAEGWTCSCGHVNRGKFCPNCGSKKPADAPLYQCDKCGWQPEDPKNPPKFCPECGDRFDENDAQ